MAEPDIAGLLADARRRSAVADTQSQQQRQAEELAQARRDAAVPPDLLQGYNPDPARQKKFLAQRDWRGISDLTFGLGDLFNTVANAGIRDIDYATGGGLSGGKYDPYQLGMPSQIAADTAADVTGQEIIPEQTMPPSVRAEGERRRTMFGALPVGPESLAPVFKTAVLHAAPNLFKSAALEDALKGVNPDRIWHDWGWEQNAKGDWWTETVGKPTMNPNVERPKYVGGALPPRTSDFPADQSAYADTDQLQLFTAREAPDVPLRTGTIPMKKPAYPARMDVSDTDPRFKLKHGIKQGTVSDYVENPQLYEQPGLEFLGGLPMQLKDEPLAQGAGGFYYPPSKDELAQGGKGKITVRSDVPHTDDRGIIKVIDKGNTNQVATAQHELTHAAAQEFGLPQGYNWQDPGAKNQGAYMRDLIRTDKKAYDDAFNKRTADYWRHEDELFDRDGDLRPEDFDESGKVIRPGYVTLTEFKKQWGKENPELQKILDDPQDITGLDAKSDEMLAYWTSMGEVSARNSARRDTQYSPQVLREMRPGMTEDVPRKFQWTQDKQTGDIINPASAPDEPSIADELASATLPAEQTKTYKHPISGIKIQLAMTGGHA